MSIPIKEVIKIQLEHVYTIYNYDCIQGMLDFIEDGMVDVVVTSPPYNLGINYKTYNDSRPRHEYLDWLDSWAAQIYRTLSDRGSVFFNIGSKPTDPTVPFEVLDVLRKHFVLQNVIHWIKSIYIEETSYHKNISVNVGHYKPINSERFLNDVHEYVFHLTKHGSVKLDRLSIGVPYKDKTNITRWQKAAKNIRCRGNTWYISYKTIQSRDRERPHPATFPPLLAEMCVKLHGLHNTRVVMDPFLGLGNAALGCLPLQVDFIGFEIDEYYYQQAVKAISDQSKSYFFYAETDHND